MKHVLKFQKHDFLFDNGLVNLCLLYNDFSRRNVSSLENASLQLLDTQLIIKGDKETLDKLFVQLYKDFASKIIYRTKNYRYYWDAKNHKLIRDKKFDVRGRSSGNDIKRLTEYKTLKELGITKEHLLNEIHKLFPLPPNGSSKKDLEEQNSNTKKLLKDNFAIKKLNRINGNTKLNVYQTDRELYCKELRLTRKNEPEIPKKQCFICNSDGAYLKFDSSVYMFNDAEVYFSDKLIKDNPKIGKWAYFIYRLGARIGRYYSETAIGNYYYLHSYSLRNLYDIKDNINIRDERVKIKDYKTKEEMEGTSNFYFIEDKDAPFRDFNFYTYGKKDKLLKLLLGIYLEYTFQKERVLDDYAFDIFKGGSIVSFSEKTIKNSLGVYSDLDRLFRFFHTLQNIHISTKKIEKQSLLSFLAQKKGEQGVRSLLTLCAKGATINKDDKEKILFQSLASAILDFKKLHKYYFQVQFNLLILKMKNKSQAVLPDSLKEFEDVYVKFVEGDDSPDRLINKLCYLVGREIGRFLGHNENKDLIFNLRAVNNKEQLISFLRDFRFRYLKEQDDNGMKNFNFHRDFNQGFDSLLNIIANDKSILMIRDYLALYVISGYEIGLYHSKKEED